MPRPESALALAACLLVGLAACELVDDSAEQLDNAGPAECRPPDNLLRLGACALADAAPAPPGIIDIEVVAVGMGQPDGCTHDNIAGYLDAPTTVWIEGEDADGQRWTIALSLAGAPGFEVGDQLRVENTIEPRAPGDFGEVCGAIRVDDATGLVALAQACGSRTFEDPALSWGTGSATCTWEDELCQYFSQPLIVTTPELAEPIALERGSIGQLGDYDVMFSGALSTEDNGGCHWDSSFSVGTRRAR